MSDLVAIAYPDQDRAAAVLAAVKQLQDEGALDLQDAVAISKNSEGHIKVEGAASRVAAGAAGGLALGALIGMIVFSPVIGAAFGAVAGGLAGSFADAERIDDFALEVSNNMPPGSSAILMLVQGPAADPERVLTELQQYGGKVIQTSLPDDVDARIRAALGRADANLA
ncbi:MAG: DUF1269 domain-containing protein [Thermomicrobiales bacterium]|nr:DUF1269 domain-containing protein [Thermomicrobiales bacterium]